VKRETESDYQQLDGIERLVVDLVRVGAAGHGAGVRQLATRALRSVPASVRDPDQFRSAVHAAITGTSAGARLRYASGEVPRDGDTQELVEVDPDPRGESLTVSSEVTAILEEIVAERQHLDSLQKSGVTATRSLLLSGAPGTGKTLTARWLAQQLGLPLVTLDLASVVSSYLGSSGKNIKAALQYADSAPCVLLLDEFDAVAKRRDDDSDIGELKRLVNVLLIELDRWGGNSLLVAATNHPQLLDPAIDRRFDRRVEIGLPGADEIARIVAGCVPDSSPALRRLVGVALRGSTGSDAVKLCESALRRTVLRKSSFDVELLALLLTHRSHAGPDRDRLWATASDLLNLSARQIASQVGVSHPTVSAALKRTARELDG
jgi:SpoVK/Ycf46/Vps4 family AAA+-type ATPase